MDATQNSITMANGSANAQVENFDIDRFLDVEGATLDTFGAFENMIAESNTAAERTVARRVSSIFDAPTPGAINESYVAALSAPTPGAYDAPTPGAYDAPTPEAYDTPTPKVYGLYPYQGGFPAPPPYDIGNDPTYSRVPLTSFPFTDLPLIPRITVLEWYLEVCGTEGSLSHCDCTKVSEGRWTDPHLSPEDLCYNLHQEFGYHAKFLPLLMTSQQMHAEFRPRRYAWGTFTIIPTNSIREPDLRNQTTRARYCQHLNYEPKLDGWPTISHITPYPENAKRRRKDAVKAPLLSFKRIDVGIWSEIREIKLDLEFSYYNDWKKVRRELAFLARMLKKRVFPLRTLYLTMTWEIAGDTGVRDIKKYNEKTSFDDNWRDIVEPLKKMTWTENVARRVQFHVKEKGRWSSGSRGYRSESVEQFLKGMTAASEEGRLDVVENGLLRYH